jgi:hypothetical protein
MLTIKEAKSGTKALFLQAASLSGLEVTTDSPERIADLVQNGFEKVSAERQPEAVANLLRVISETLMYAQENGLQKLSEATVQAGRERVCPVFPFDNQPR